MSWRENLMSPPLWGTLNLGTKIYSSWKVKTKVVPTPGYWVQSTDHPPTVCVGRLEREGESEDRLMYSNATVGIADDKAPIPSFCLSLVSIVLYILYRTVLLPLRNPRVNILNEISEPSGSRFWELLANPDLGCRLLTYSTKLLFFFLVSSTWPERDSKLRESLNARHATQPTQPNKRYGYRTVPYLTLPPLLALDFVIAVLQDQPFLNTSSQQRTERIFNNVVKSSRYSTVGRKVSTAWPAH